MEGGNYIKEGRDSARSTCLIFSPKEEDEVGALGKYLQIFSVCTPDIYLMYTLFQYFFYTHFIYIFIFIYSIHHLCGFKPYGVFHSTFSICILFYFNSVLLNFFTN